MVRLSEGRLSFSAFMNGTPLVKRFLIDRNLIYNLILKCVKTLDILLITYP